MNCVVNFSFADEKFCLTFWRHKQTFFFLYKHEFFNFGLGSYCRPSGRICSPACMRKSRRKKSQIFQRLSLFSILYDHLLKFSNNRDKEFYSESCILIFLLPETTPPAAQRLSKHSKWSWNRSDHSWASTFIDSFEETFIKLAQDFNVFVKEVIIQRWK